MSELRVVAPVVRDERDEALRADLRKLAEAINRLVDEHVRDRQERAQAKTRGRKRANTIRSTAPIPATVPPEAHAAAERVIARLGRSR